MRDFIQKNSLLFLFFILDILVLIKFNINFATNDDLRISFVASGTMLVPNPSEFMLYTNIVFGFLLKLLYSSIPQLPWYFIVLASCLILSHMTILYIINKYSNTYITILIGLVYIVFFIQLTFTEVAILLSISGMLLLYDYILSSASINFKSIELFFISFSLFMASIIRFESFLLAFIFGIIFIILFSDKKINIKTISITSIYFVLLIAINIYSTYYYKTSPGWENFFEYNKYKIAILDHHIGDISQNLPEALQKENWSKNDYNMLRSWLFFNNTTYSLEKLSDFVHHLQPDLLKKLKYLKSFYIQLFHDRFVFILILISIGIFITRKFSKIEALKLTFVFLLINAAFISITVLFKEPPSRVYKSILFFMVLVFAINGKNRNFLSFKQNIPWLGTLLVSFIIIYYSFLLNKSNFIMHKTFSKVITSLNPKNCYLSISNAMEIRGIDARNNLIELKKYTIIPFGTLMLSHDVQLHLKNKGIFGDLFFYIFKKKDCFLIIRNDKLNLLNLIKNYIYEHYDKKVKIKKINNNGFSTLVSIVEE